MMYKVPVIAVANQKGGVGKTTLASILAEAAAILSGLRVLVIDLDMQCNTSDYWVGMEADANAVGGQIPPKHPDYEGEDFIEERSSIADIFYGKAVIPHETHLNPENGYAGHVDVAVGHPALLENINTEYDNLSGKITSAIVNRLAEFIHTDELADAYDLVILDTGPSRNPIFRAALRSSTHFIIPFEPEEKSLQGINAMLQARAFENYSRVGSELNLVGLLPNKVRSNTNLHRDTLAAIYEALPSYMPPRDVFLPQSTAFPERDIKGINPKSVFELPASHRARQASYVVSRWVLGTLGFSELDGANDMPLRGNANTKSRAGGES